MIVVAMLLSVFKFSTPEAEKLTSNSLAHPTSAGRTFIVMNSLISRMQTYRFITTQTWDLHDIDQNPRRKT